MQEHATEFQELDAISVDGTLFDVEDTSLFAHKFNAPYPGHLEFWFRRPAISVSQAKVGLILA